MDNLSLYILTFNCGREAVDPAVFAPEIFSALPSSSTLPSVLVISLQEVAPIPESFVGGSWLAPYTAAIYQSVALAASQHAVSQGDGQNVYVHQITRNVGMTALMVFVHSRILQDVKGIEDAAIGVGWNSMGNKGAVAVRLGISVKGDLLLLTFVGAHLAHGEDACERRNADWENIVRGLVFQPSTDSRFNLDSFSNIDEAELLPAEHGSGSSELSGIYTSTSHLFLAGDLNYRTSSTAPTTADLPLFPQPTALPDEPQHYSQILPNDQLNLEKNAGRTLHGLCEKEINFPPTYKYSSMSEPDDKTWHWAPHRWPSWCDRILYRPLPSWMPQKTSGMHLGPYHALPLMPTSDHRPVALSLSIPFMAIPEPASIKAAEDIRLAQPFPLDKDYRVKRAWARQQEIAFGIAAYYGWTWKGNGVVFAGLVGSLGGWAVLRGLLAT